jgi:hypothetical protein
MPRGIQAPGAWLIGFLEGYDAACPKDKPLAAGLDSEAVFERVDRICSSSRTGDTPLLLVAFDLVKELDPQHTDSLPALGPQWISRTFGALMESRFVG